MPRKPNKRQNECLDMGSGMVTLSRDHLFAIVRGAVKEALVSGKQLPANTPDEALEARARGSASVWVDELVHGRKP